MNVLDERTLIKNTLLSKFPNSVVKVAGNSSHFAVSIISKYFNNKSTLEQHRMVYKALNNMLEGRLHALQIITKPQEE